MRRLLVLPAALVAALGLLSAAQGGSFPGTNGLIAYSCNSTSICSANPDGSSASTLIATGSDPAWSPNGTKIAFAQGGNVYTASADGSSQTLFETGASQPTWGTDNATLYFVKSDGRIYSKASVSAAAQPVTAGPNDSDPAFSPAAAGSKLAFTSLSGGLHHIFIATIGGSTTQLTSGTGEEVAPSWSPDGTTIVFETASGLWKVPSAGGSPTQIVNATDAHDPSFSPDGSKIVYATDSGSLVVVNSDGSNALTIISPFSNALLPDWGTAPVRSTTPPPDTGTGPKNTAYPVITLASGDSSPVIGHAMTASVGSWNPAFGNTYTYQWKRCEAADPVNGSCFNIAGAISFSYAPVPADFGFRIRVAVTAANSSGRTTQNSEVTAPTIAIAVKLRATPQITPGPPQQTVVDTPLSLTAGTWDGSTPIAFTYSWRRCDPVGDPATCVQIVGATAATYTPTVADIGFSLRVWITGSNLAGSDTAVTNHTYPVVDKPHFAPSVVSAPNIAGTALPGRQLTANIGSFKGDSPIATSFHWYRCDAVGAACHAIPKATKVVYYPNANDVGYTLRLFVFAKNTYGQLLAQSDPTPTIAATPPHVRGKRIVGTSHGDYLAGGGHDDTIIGLAGNDTLLGGAGDDRLEGGPGNDVITGGSGADRIDAGAGSDTINAADGERDVIDCGDGNDHAIVDPYDVVTNCEVVDKQSTTP